MWRIFNVVSPTNSGARETVWGNSEIIVEGESAEPALFIDQAIAVTLK